MKLESLNYKFNVIINDFNKNKFNYEEAPPISEIEITTPISIELLRLDYFSREKSKCIDEQLLNLYFTWDLASSLILYLEKYRGSTTTNYWGEVDTLRNPLKTRLLINKAGFAYEKDLFHIYKKPFLLGGTVFLVSAHDILDHFPQPIQVHLAGLSPQSLPFP